MNYSYKELYESKLFFEEGLDELITDEMRNHFIKRTNYHIKLVQKYAKKIFDYKGNQELLDNVKNHDNNKFKNPEVTPYILITWNYYCKDNNIDFPEYEKFKNLCNEATEHHILNSSHHPEFWQDKKTGLVPTGDRDKFNPNSDIFIDATKMDAIAIQEMCADWMAMSEERGNSPQEWADKVINKRWKFTGEQVKYIYSILDNVWKN